MNKRRTLLKAASLTPVLLATRSFAAPPSADPSRVALVIGNNAYPQAPLNNPVNDARAVGDLLRRANFNVNLLTDASRDAFMAAIEKFGDAVAKSDSKLALFYYAGHGAQVSWKNYLLPVDATIRSPQDLEARCIDLGQLLGRAAKTGDKTLVVILDACRNNPFGPDYQPQQKGLSQFDAPVGSLLAYATAPGSVASDGSGKHGLYTENLLRELSTSGTSIEDAFKRVRLNVRLGSANAQIPWESTSLEESVFLFPSARKMDEAELEKLLEEELVTWDRIKASKKIEDWASYLRTYPNGKFSEIAQIRLNRLLTPVTKVAPVVQVASLPPAAPPAPVAAVPPTVPPAPVVLADPAAAVPPAPVAVAPPAVPPAPIKALAEVAAVAKVAAVAPVTEIAPVTKAAPIAKVTPVAEAAPKAEAAPVKPAPETAPPPRPEIAAAKPVAPPPASPLPISPSQAPNPYSAGTFALGRNYKLGDQISYRISDNLTDIEEKTIHLLVTLVDLDADRVEFNHGMWVSDTSGNLQKTGRLRYVLPVQMFPAELQIGKKWTTRFAPAGKALAYDLELRIPAREIVQVPAGEFNAFRIEGRGWAAEGQSIHTIYWVVPGLNPPYVKREFTVRNQKGAFRITERHELVAFRQ